MVDVVGQRQTPAERIDLFGEPFALFDRQPQNGGDHFRRKARSAEIEEIEGLSPRQIGDDRIGHGANLLPLAADHRMGERPGKGATAPLMVLAVGHQHEVFQKSPAATGRNAHRLGKLRAGQLHQTLVGRKLLHVVGPQGHDPHGMGAQDGCRTPQFVDYGQRRVREFLVRNRRNAVFADRYRHGLPS